MKKGILSQDEDSVRFHIGIILLAIEYLHMKDIIHRDIRPGKINNNKRESSI